MGVPLYVQVAHHPATSAITALLVGLWAWLLQRGMSPAAVGFSYHRFVTERQWWCAIAAQLSHFELLHLLLNISSLWGVSALAEPADQPGAFLEYLRLSMLLLLASAAILLALHHAALAVLVRITGHGGGGDPAQGVLERLRHTPMVGYSCVLFGWMTKLAWSSGSGARFGLLGVASVPMPAAPFVLLVVTQVLLPRASLLGHLSGVLAGLLLAVGCLDWLTPYWTVCLLGWVAIGIVYGLALEGRLGPQYVRLLPYGSESFADESLEAVRFADFMERGSAGLLVERGAGGAAAGAGGTSAVTTAAGAAASTARDVGAAAAAALSAVAMQLQSWVGAARRQMQSGGGRGRTGLMELAAQVASGGGAAVPPASSGAAVAASGPALPWASWGAATVSPAAGGGSYTGRDSSSGYGGPAPGGSGSGGGLGSGGTRERRED